MHWKIIKMSKENIQIKITNSIGDKYLKKIQT